MNKEGHIGVVKSTEKPIVKGGALKYLAAAQGKLNDSLDASTAAINSVGGTRNGEVGGGALPKSRQSHMSSNPGYL